MKKRTLRLLSVLMIVSLLVVGTLPASAVSVDTSGKKLLRIASVMNGDTENSRGISWATAGKTESIVLVSENADMSDSKEYTGGVEYLYGYYMHKVVVNGLKPGTTYYYTVGDRSLRSRICSFETDAGRDGSFNFIAFADVQASSEENFIKASRVVQAGYALAPDAAFSVNLGDFVNDCTNDEWNWYFENFAFLNDNMSMAPVAGNHEGNLKWDWFDGMFALSPAPGSETTTGDYYSFDYGDAHFAVLNSNDMYPMSDHQLNWLQNDMQNSDATWKIVMMHRSLYSAGKHTNKPDTSIMRNVLIPVIDKLGIDLVLSGHEHMYLRTNPVVGEGEMPETTYVTELYNGEETTFAVDPAGTIHVMPATAGTKRYAINENTMDYIINAAAAIDTVRDKGGVVTNITVDGDKLVYKAYLVSDETVEPSLFDQFAIKKTTTGSVDPNWVDLPEGSGSFMNVQNTIYQIVWVLLHYIFDVLPMLFR